MQDFFIKNTTYVSIIDSNYRYFSGKDSPNINTIIVLFSRRNNNCRIVRYIHTNCNLESINHSISFVDQSKNDIDLQRYEYSNKKLQYKWGFLFQIPKWLFKVLEVLESEIVGSRNIEFGQGLNITSDHAITYGDACEIGVPKSALLPFCKKTCSFHIDNPSLYIIDHGGINKTLLKKITQNGFKVFSSEKSRKVPADFIMPRGIVRHYCAFNEIKAFSDSCVEIYLNHDFSLKDRYSIWAFCNSSLYWLLRELTGRTNLGGGMLKSEASDVSKIPIPFTKLNPFYHTIKEIHKNCSLREPLESKEEVLTCEHNKIDQIISEALNIRKYENRIRNTLIERISYRETKSIS